MSRAEEITSEVHRLAVTCRTLEAQLKESVPKKVHNETVAKMQTDIDGLKSELDRSREELRHTQTVDQAITSLEERVNALSRICADQSQILAALASRLDEGTVPNVHYTNSQSRIRQLEAEVASMSSTTVKLDQLEEAEARVRTLEDALSKSTPDDMLTQLKDNISQLVSEALPSEPRRGRSEAAEMAPAPEEPAQAPS